jgi:replicative DNA helicase
VFLLSVEDKVDETKDRINCHIAKNRGGETDLMVTLGFEKSTGNWSTSLGEKKETKPW